MTLLFIVACQEGDGVALTVDDLADAGELKIQLEGHEITSYPSNVRCLYFEWTYGLADGDRFQKRWSGYQSEESFTVVTSKGRLDLSARQVRLYVAADFTHTYDASDRAQAPDVVKQAMKEEKRPVTVQEHRLVAGRTYFAKVHVDSYMLPPEPGEHRPRQGRNAVLWISDVPFVDGKPARAITPAYEGWSY